MNTYPHLCQQVGLDCESCTEGTARHLEKVCKGVRGRMIGQLFAQIYTDPACAKMHTHFAAAYMKASVELPRKMAASAERHRAIAAVA
jgi:hypothetical protein